MTNDVQKQQSPTTSAPSPDAPVSSAPRPTDDLYLHVNGSWIENHTIPADRAIDGAFHALRDQAEADVRAIIENAAESTRIGTLYSSFMNTDAINAAGIAPLAADLADIAIAHTKDAHTKDVASAVASATTPAATTADTAKDFLALALARLDRLGVSGPAAYWIEKDSASNDAVLYLVQAGLGLPDEAYYREESHAETLAQYQSHISRMLSLLLTSAKNTSANDNIVGKENTAVIDNTVGGEVGAGEAVSVIKQACTAAGLTTPADAEKAAERIVQFERAIAAGHWDVVAKRDALKTYNMMDTTELPEGFPFGKWLREGGVTQQRCVVMMPSYLEHFSNLWQETPIADLQLWALWRVLRSRSGYLPDAFVEESFDFYGRTLSGAEQQRDRWKRGVNFVEGAVGQEVGKEYIAEHFPAEYKEQMLELVDYLLAAYRERISSLEWMTPQTRERALEKLSLFKAKIGYPNTWRDYSALQVGRELNPTDLMGNARATAAFSHDYEVAKLGKPANRDEWFANPQTVNAFYNPVVNDITFPAAILKPPFFDPTADMASNFGAIGAVIGHEIGHGFDDQGSHYDGHGNLNQWWTDQDRAAFEALTAKLVDQFNGLIPTGLKDIAKSESITGVNGTFTLGENIGDLGGLGIAVVAFRRWLHDHGTEFGLTDTPETYRGMFLSWALVWRTAIRPELSRQYLAIDPHSPAEFRCNVIVTDIDEFHSAFGTAPGDGMWRDPQDRVHIW